MDLPKHWRGLPTSVLDGWLTTYGDKLTDRNGLMIENFGLPCNLMLSIPANIVEGGLEACLQSIRSRPPVTA